jgi:hypothetical protein
VLRAFDLAVGILKTGQVFGEMREEKNMADRDDLKMP